MMKELLFHLDELNVHIKNLDDEIDQHMNLEEKQAMESTRKHNNNFSLIYCYFSLK